MTKTDIGMTLEDFEEALAEIISSEFEIKKVKGKIVIYTNLAENDYGELVDLNEDSDPDLDEEDEDDMFYDEEDEDVDMSEDMD